MCTLPIFLSRNPCPAVSLPLPTYISPPAILAPDVVSLRRAPSAVANSVPPRSAVQPGLIAPPPPSRSAVPPPPLPPPFALSPSPDSEPSRPSSALRAANRRRRPVEASSSRSVMGRPEPPQPSSASRAANRCCRPAAALSSRSVGARPEPPRPSSAPCAADHSRRPAAAWPSTASRSGIRPRRPAAFVGALLGHPPPKSSAPRQSTASRSAIRCCRP
ncbi:hypothetical protein ACP70R_023092 [Stipagrostis hirtigluma subsp. patula]